MFLFYYRQLLNCKSPNDKIFILEILASAYANIVAACKNLVNVPPVQKFAKYV